MTLQLLNYELPYICGKFDFFISVARLCVYYSNARIFVTRIFILIREILLCRLRLIVHSVQEIQESKNFFPCVYKAFSSFRLAYFSSRADKQSNLTPFHFKEIPFRL